MLVFKLSSLHPLILVSTISVAALLLFSGSAEANVTWDFTVTRFYDTSTQTQIAISPTVVGIFTVTDAEFLSGGLNYSFSATLFPTSFQQTGDSDFFLEFTGDSNFYMPAHDSYGGPSANGSISILFDSSGDISGDIFLSTWTSRVRMSISDDLVVGSTAAADYTVFNLCGDCGANYDGYWSLASSLPVPEPSSLAILGSGLGTLAFLRRRRVKV